MTSPRPSVRSGMLASVAGRLATLASPFGQDVMQKALKMAPVRRPLPDAAQPRLTVKSFGSADETAARRAADKRQRKAARRLAAVNRGK